MLNVVFIKNGRDTGNSVTVVRNPQPLKDRNIDISAIYIASEGFNEPPVIGEYLIKKAFSE
jgi:hypothetical protein